MVRAHPALAPRLVAARGRRARSRLGTLLGALAPVLLDPLFNDFTPLPEGTLRGDVLALAEAAGVRVGEVFSVDASRRTTAANAYVTGLGPTKRVVLFDTLLDRYEPRRGPLGRRPRARPRRAIATCCAASLFGAIVAAPAALATQRLSGGAGPAAQRGPPGCPRSRWRPACVAAAAGLIANRLSRAIERRADAFALRLAGAPEAFISFERAIALQNVADLDPPRVGDAAALATHPSTAERIGAAALAAQSPAERARPP